MILNFWAAILILLTLGWLYTLYWAGKNCEHDLGAMSFMVGGFLMAVLWLPVNLCYHAKEVNREIPVKVNVLESAIILTSDGVPIYTITNVPTYNKFKGLTNAVIIQEGYVDMYGNTNYEKYRAN
jgi:hypothetical protein